MKAGSRRTWVSRVDFPLPKTRLRRRGNNRCRFSMFVHIPVSSTFDMTLPLHMQCYNMTFDLERIENSERLPDLCSFVEAPPRQIVCWGAEGIFLHYQEVAPHRHFGMLMIGRLNSVVGPDGPGLNLQLGEPRIVLQNITDSKGTPCSRTNSFISGSSNSQVANSASAARLGSQRSSTFSWLMGPPKRTDTKVTSFFQFGIRPLGISCGASESAGHEGITPPARNQAISRACPGGP